MVARLKGHKPVWFDHAVSELDRLVKLPGDWDSYGGLPPSLLSSRRVLEILNDVMTDISPSPAFVPTSRGGIQLEWHRRGIDLEVEVNELGQVDGTFDDHWLGDEWEGDLLADLGPFRRAVALLDRPVRDFQGQ